MKKTFHFLIMSSLILLFAASCKKDQAEVKLVLPLNDNSLPSGAVSNVKLTNKTSNTLEFTLDLTVFRDSKNIENQLRSENFSIDTFLFSSFQYYFTQLNVKPVNGSSASPYSALMLMDQSGSILTTDPNDYRLDAAKAFCSNLGQGDNVMLWSFSGSTQQKYGTAFTGNGSLLIPDIEGLNGNEGGATPLYRSQYVVTDFAATNAPSANKAVMTFTDGEDTQGGYSSQEVIDNAVAKNVKLFNVGLGSAQTQVLSNQAVATGGAFMFAQDARQLISMFGNLGKMLNKTAQYYHTSWKITSNGSFGTGTISTEVHITLPYNNIEITVPFNLSY